MQTARESATGRVWTAEEYARAPVAPTGLVCEGTLPDGAACGAPAFHRRQSLDGRRPCFFSTGHGEGCTSGSIASDDEDGDRGHSVQAVSAPVGRLVLNLAPAEPSVGPDGRRVPDDVVTTSVTARHTRAVGVLDGAATMRHRLRTVLARLLGEGYPPELLVEFDGAAAAPAGRFFVDLRDAVPADLADLVDQQHGFYGRVRAVYVDPDDGTWTIYLAGTSNVRVILAAAAAVALPAGTPDSAALKGGHVLALGGVQESKRTPGNWYVRVQQPVRIGFITT
jgi:hypothetical protein